MDGVGTPISGRPPLPGHDTPNPERHPDTLNCEEPVINAGLTTPRIPRSRLIVRSRLAIWG